jgi:hypothetical protein
MKKLIIAIIALTALCGFSQTINNEFYYDVDLTPATSGSAAVATYTFTGTEKVVFPMALFQTVGGTTQTNTVTLKIVPKGSTSAYTVDTLAAVSSGVSTLETFGIGDVTADIDPIWLNSGDTLNVTGAGTASSNVTYRIRLKSVKQ